MLPSAEVQEEINLLEQKLLLFEIIYLTSSGVMCFCFFLY